MNMSERIQSLQNKFANQADRVKEIIDNTEDVAVYPGLYEVTETDFGGERDYVKFVIELQEELNLKEVALMLMELKGYMSPWNDLRIQPYKKPYNTLVLPKRDNS